MKTAVGKFPVKAVKCMTKIAMTAEKHPEYQYFTEGRETLPIIEILGRTCSDISNEPHLNLKAILTNTQSGQTTQLVAKYRPSKIIIAGTPYAHIKRRLNLVWGVYPIQTKLINSSNGLKYFLVKEAMKREIQRAKLW